MVEDHWHRQPFQHILQLDDAFSFRDELDVPAELGDLSGDLIHVLHRRATREPRSQADPAHTLVVELLQLVRLHGCVQHYNAPRIAPECFQSLDKQAIVSAVGRWLDDDVQLKPRRRCSLR